jgi:hypothetical protein
MYKPGLLSWLLLAIAGIALPVFILIFIPA